MKKIASHYIAVLTGAAILFASCAVLTIDVDVYKGALANHEDIQTEQMAAMAIGAKPLLVELRDRLEVEDCQEYNSVQGKCIPVEDKCYESLEELRAQKWYLYDYVEPNSTRECDAGSLFKDSEAVTVNNVLYLYKNRIPDEFLELHTRANRALKRYKDAYASLRPKKMVDDESLAKSIKSIEGESKNKKKLKRAYVNFLRDKKRDALCVIKYSLIWLEQSKNKDNRIRGLKTNPLLKRDAQAAKKVPNAAFHILAETNLVDLHTELVFKLQGDPKKELVSRIKEIARTYLEARAALEDLWRISIETIIYINRRPMAEGETEEQRRELTGHFAGLSLELIQPLYLAVLVKAIEGEELPEDVEAFRLSYMTYANRHSLRKFPYEQAKATLRDRLIADPIERAGKLLVAHEFSKHKFKLEGISKDILRDSLAYKQGWEFGLARAPYDNLATDDLRVVTQKTEQAFAGKGGAFGGGRLDKGLERLIEEYLNLAANDMDNEDEVEFARRQLTNALVRFAEKVLFVANNNSLLQDPTENEPGLIVGLADVTIRGLFGKALNKRDEPHKYVRILQAVGNSILVQADALQQERQYRERLKDHYEKEVTILADTVSRMSPVHRNTVGIKPVDELLPEGASAKDVRDVWIELLEYEHDLALYYGETKRAKEINDALEAARIKREGMIFIRPAMAYLRTSFPATSLQSNPNLTWDNMLGGHMMRSIPFGPQIGEFLNPDAKRDARINAEIDKQFWQNINRVRVAGGGNTNYAVVKDDIGNWYVKGYSADPCDVIKSARNLAMFSLSAKMNTDFLKRTNRDNGGQPSTDKSDANQTAVERLYNKYKDQYNSRTCKDREQLIELLKSEMKSAIMQAWQQNDGLKGSISMLENKLDAAIELHLKKPADELKETKDVTEHGSKIISALHAIRRFHNTLLADVHNTITASARDKLLRAEKRKATRELELSKTKEIYSDFAIEKDMVAIDWNYKSAAAAEDPDNSVKKQISDEAKDELDRVKAAFMRAEKEVEEKQAALKEATDKFETKSIEFDTAVSAEERSIRDVTRIVREKIMTLITSRIDSIKEYETAIMFIGESNKQ